MNGFARWLGDQLDEDERIARAAIRAVGDVPGGVPGAAHWRFGNAYSDESGTYWQITTMPPNGDVFGPVELIGSGETGGGAHEPEFARHAVQHDPARVLLEIEAKREQLAEHPRININDLGSDCGTCCVDGFNVPWPCRTLRLLTPPYGRRPGYREEWRP